MENTGHDRGWAHFIAIGGTGMGALASMLQDLGFRVTGSDGPLYPPMSLFIDSKNIPRTETYSSENLLGARWGFHEAHPTLIIIGNAIGRSNLEAAFAEELVASGRSKKMSFAQALAEFCIRDRESFVVAGTHGKTSTTTQLAWALESLGLSPGFFIGGIPANFSQGCRMGEGSCFASEGDEYDTAYWDKESKFLHYRPSWVLCTGIEFDHADIYANIEAIEKSFHKLITKTATGWVHVDVESAPHAQAIHRLESALATSGLKSVAYGRAPTSPYRLLKLSEELVEEECGIWGSVVEIQTPQWGTFKVSSPLSGEHNALNLLGIVAVLAEAGKIKDPSDIQKYLSSFKGVKRRQEELYRSPDLIVIDDFAHHPTAIRETVRAIRKKYPRYDVAAFFEPRSATSARNVFQKEFTDCFVEATHVYLTPPTKSNVPDAEKLDVYRIRNDLEGRGVQAFVTSEVTELAARFKKDFDARPDKSRGVVALVMSNGAFGGIHQKLFEGRGQGLRGGQVAIEWILMCLMLVLVGTAVLAPMRAQFAKIQRDIASNTLGVMEQKELGIPIRWFSLEGDGDLDGAFDRGIGALSQAGGGGGGGGPGGGPNGPNGPGGGDAPGGDDPAGPQGPGPSTNPGGPTGPRSPSGSPSDGDSSSASSSASSGDKAPRAAPSTSSSGSSSGNSSFDGESASSERGREAAASGGEEAEGAEEESGGDAKKKAQYFDGRQENLKKGGCDDIDFATLLQLIAVIGIVVIGAIIMLSGRGGGKNNT